MSSAPTRTRRTSGSLGSLALEWTHRVPPELARRARQLSGTVGFSDTTRTTLDDEADWDEDADDADYWTEAAAIDASADDGELVISARWHTDTTGRRLLSLVYASGVQVWHATGDVDGPINELYNLRGTDRVIDACLFDSPGHVDPLMALATSPSRAVGHPGAVLTIMSLTSSAPLASAPLSASVTNVRANSRYVVVSCESPASVHIFSADRLCPVRSPIMDVAGAPAFDLSRGRLLAYASTQSPPTAHILSRDPKWQTDGASGAKTPETGRRARDMLIDGAKAVGDIGWHYWSGKKYSQSAPAASTSSSGQRPIQTASAVRVVDLKTGKDYALFRPSRRPVSTLTFDPSGSMLVTISVQSRSAHVFELRGADRPVWHRYTLECGPLNTRVINATWSMDNKFLAITSSKGSARVFAVSPDGDLLDVKAHFESGHRNADRLPPLSVRIGAVARLRPPRVSTPRSTASSSNLDLSPLSPSALFLPAASGTCPIALYYPRLGSLVLDKLVSVDTEPVSSAKSGLSRLFRGPRISSWSSSVRAQHVSVWQVQRNGNFGPLLATESVARAQPLKPAGVSRAAAQAELQTFSRSAEVIPPSIYTSHQFDFATFGGSATRARFARGDLRAVGTKPVALRRNVSVSRPPESDASLREAMLGLSVAISASPPTVPERPSPRSGPPIWQSSIPMPTGQRSTMGSTPSTTPYSISFEDDDGRRDGDSLTPASTAERSDDGDETWGFANAAQSHDTHRGTTHIEGAVERDHLDDLGVGLLDEQQRERIESTLQPPQQPSRSNSTGSKKRKAKKSPATGQSPARTD